MCALVAGALVICAAVIFPVSALAATNYSGASPAPGASIIGRPDYASVFADADSKILTTSKLAIDGVDMSTSVDWLGHAEGTDCETIWVVDDDTAATLSCPTIGLAAGTHTAVATVITESSGTSTYSWSFTLTFPADNLAVFSARIPAPGTTITAFQQLKVTVESSNTLVGSGGGIFLDGTRIPNYYQTVNAKKLTLVTNAEVPMTDGPHTVRATIVDSAHIPTDDTWSFSVAVKPTLSVPVVAETSVTAGQSPIRVITADNTPGQLRLVLKLDGAQVFDGMVPQGEFQWDPPGGLPVGSSHTVRADVYDAAGNTETRSWAFTAPSASAPVFIDAAPTAGAGVVGSPQYVSVFVDAATDVLSTSSMTLDGVSVNTTVDWPGHVEDPDCEAIWVVDDYTAATLSCTPSVLTPGMHTVAVTVRTAVSGSSTYSWSFTVSYPADQLATFSARVPSPNTTITALSQARVTIESSNTLNGQQGSLYLDGTRLNGWYTPSGSGKTTLYSYSAIPATDGQHTLRATILDALRIPSEDSWTFNVAVKPTISSPEPADGSTVHVARPVIRVTTADNTPGPVRVVLRVDGVQKYDGMVAQGVFRWDPAQDIDGGPAHTVRVDVTDAAGNVAVQTWSFTIQPAAPMSTEGDCTSCHQASAHPFNECTACHQDDPLYDPHGPNRFGPVGPCYDCHGSGYTHTISSDCNYCHASTQWTQIPRHAPTMAAKHDTVVTSGCDSCHSASLIDEHGKYPAASSFKYQCAVCHTSARPEVSEAITANDTDCLSCHPTFESHRPAHDPSATPSDSRCVPCHDGNLVDEHVTKRGLTCASCHDASSASAVAPQSKSGGFSLSAVTAAAGASAAAMTPSDIASAIANGVTSCEACHGSAVNHVAAHDNPSLDPECASCHVTNVSEVHGDACDTCHASSDPDVIAAVAAGDLNCTACHSMVGHPALSRTWMYNQDYYSWGTVTTGGSLLSSVGANPTNPGVHGNYQSTTAKCGICHSVHRANASGVKLLDTETAACVGCHKAGVSTVSATLVSWQSGGPHGSGVDGDCASRGCHLDNPHGAGGSKYKIVAAKMITPAVDAVLEATSGPLSNVAASGITIDDLNAAPTSTWDSATRSAVVAGYTCNAAGCHEQTMLAVLRPGWSEQRRSLYPDGATVLKSGHVSSGEASETHGAYAPVTTCTSCHDQTDLGTRSGFTFPHSQSAFATATSNTGSSRAYLWMTLSGSAGASLTPMATTNQKSFDGACLKCHRSAGNVSGIGIEH